MPRRLTRTRKHALAKAKRRMKRIGIALFTLSGILVATAMTNAYMIWHEGALAGEKAEALLAESGFASPGPMAGTGTQNVKPEEPGDTPAILPPGTWEGELEGYTVIARLDIDALDIHLPVLSGINDDALRVSVCYYTGPAPGAQGNLVITGHDYKNGAHFGRLKMIGIGDAVTLTGPEGDTWTYTVYEIEHIKPDDIQAVGSTRYERELTLMTCEKDGNGRLLVRCRASGCR